MEVKDYKAALEAMYREVYRAGRCFSADVCERTRTGEYMLLTCVHQFYKAKLGSRYGKDGRLRVMFVGKEGTSQGVLSGYEIGEPIPVGDAEKRNSHYFGTIYTAALLLDETKPSSFIREDLLSLSEIHHCFCLTNYFKCAFKAEEKHSNVRTAAKMGKNCAKILLREIDVLRPQVIVMQGKFYHRSFWKMLKGAEAYSYDEEADWDPGNGVSLTWHRYPDNEPFCFIWSYHPSAPAHHWHKSLDDLHTALTIAKDRLQKA